LWLCFKANTLTHGRRYPWLYICWDMSFMDSYCRALYTGK
jgi:hypothetical protein